MGGAVRCIAIGLALTLAAPQAFAFVPVCRATDYETVWALLDERGLLAVLDSVEISGPSEIPIEPNPDYCVVISGEETLFSNEEITSAEVRTATKVVGFSLDVLEDNQSATDAEATLRGLNETTFRTRVELGWPPPYIVWGTGGHYATVFVSFPWPSAGSYGQ